ncbi:hypothetical protein KV697_13785 [Sphingomonas sanguinis]|uniref:hypothetical protein n=1 Tax=Sphingomonas sanguinis TaxID=33051 RepID=UPI001C593926|nr:hypothetical protein [Sphingomonas sanguinis]QXT34846.1 hypothetical protein KV697_13785 [Sphingomonas sanguinis]
MTFSNTPRAELAGLLDPAGLGLGFMIPVFSAPLENARLVQRIGRDGLVERFEIAEDQDTALLPVGNRTVSLGDEALWGFRFGDETIACEEAALRDRLFELVEEEAMRSRPMLGFEVATFLGNGDLENRYARLAMRRLVDLTPDGARDWRDLSVLTPMLRRSLASMRGARGTAWLDELYVSLDRSSASVHGMPGATSGDVSVLRRALDEVTARLPDLFDRPKAGWTLRLAEEGDPEHERAAPDLWITVLGARLTHLLDGGVAGKALDVGVRTLGSVVPKEFPTTAIVFEARDRDAEEEARQAAVDMRTMMIAVGTSRRGVAEPSPTNLRDFPHGRIDLPNVGAYQAGALQKTDAVAVRLAAAIAAELAEGIYDAPHPRSVLLRAAGRSDAPYVLASLYGRAWSLGLTPWNAVHVVDPGARDIGVLLDDDVRRCLFDGVEVVGGRLVNRALVGSRASGGLLVSSAEADVDDESRHASNAAALMKGGRWRIENARRSGEPRFRAVGGRRAFSVRLPDMWSGKMADAGRKPAPTSPTVDFERIETLRLVPTSSSMVMLDCLRVGEFPVEMRDLLELEADLATIWSVVALQLRRLSSPLPSRVKSLVLASVVRAVVARSGFVDVEAGSVIYDVLDDEHLGAALQLVLTHARWSDGTLRGTISVVERPHGGAKHVPIRPFESYELLIDAEGPRLRALRSHVPSGDSWLA